MNRALLEKPFEPSQIKQRQGNFGHILDYVNARTGYVMCDGTIGCVGDPHEMLGTIREKGYNECIKCYLGRIPLHE